MVYINTTRFATAVAQIPTNIKYGCCKVASAISYVAHRALKGVANFFAAIRDFFFRPRPAAPRVIQPIPQAAPRLQIPPQPPQPAPRPNTPGPQPDPGPVLECVICSEGPNAAPDKVAIRAARCGHLFHEKCIRAWTNQNNTCPICREPEPCNFDYGLPPELARIPDIAHRPADDDAPPAARAPVGAPAPVNTFAARYVGSGFPLRPLYFP